MCNVVTEVFGFKRTFLFVSPVSNVFVIVNFICQLDWVPRNLVKPYFGCLCKDVLDDTNTFIGRVSRLPSIVWWASSNQLKNGTDQKDQRSPE